jgi:hypothetical protein
MSAELASDLLFDVTDAKTRAHVGRLAIIYEVNSPRRWQLEKDGYAQPLAGELQQLNKGLILKSSGKWQGFFEAANLNDLKTKAVGTLKCNLKLATLDPKTDQACIAVLVGRGDQHP